MQIHSISCTKNITGFKILLLRHLLRHDRSKISIRNVMYGYMFVAHVCLISAVWIFKNWHNKIKNDEFIIWIYSASSNNSTAVKSLFLKSWRYCYFRTLTWPPNYVNSQPESKKVLIIFKCCRITKNTYSQLNFGHTVNVSPGCLLKSLKN
jgi:hypothetical protein